MKKIIALFLALGSISAFASSEDRMPYCWVNGERGHMEFDLNSKPIDSGKPFGVIELSEHRKNHALTLTRDGETTIIEFKGPVSITRQKVEGAYSHNGNLVCLRR
jgi:hypothetical protein